MEHDVYLSWGNKKMDKVSSVSTLSGITCIPDAPCLKSCFAKRLTHVRKTLKESWQINTSILQEDMTWYFDRIDHHLKCKKPILQSNLFRWHVSGDIPSLEYFDRMIRLARKHKDMKFLAFTKQYAIINSFDKRNVPMNLKPVFSAWPGLELVNPNGYPVAWVRSKRNPDPRIPALAIECFSGCESCGMCWCLREIKRDVVFDLR